MLYRMNWDTYTQKLQTLVESLLGRVEAVIASNRDQIHIKVYLSVCNVNEVPVGVMILILLSI